MIIRVHPPDPSDPCSIGTSKLDVLTFFVALCVVRLAVVLTRGSLTMTGNFLYFSYLWKSV
jgi:hypothetical protein